MHRVDGLGVVTVEVRLRRHASVETVRPQPDAHAPGGMNSATPAALQTEANQHLSKKNSIMKPSAEQTLESLREALRPLTAEYVVKGRMVELRVYDAPNIDPYIVLLPLSKLENMRGISQVVLEARQYLAVSTARSKKLASSDD
jgi:hypothetical protein